MKVCFNVFLSIGASFYLKCLLENLIYMYIKFKSILLHWQNAIYNVQLNITQTTHLFRNRNTKFIKKKLQESKPKTHS